ncbi:hypothetical protein U0R10_02085 [Aquirufa sp. OSTEICH-129V]|uniref:Uncharacterized protein n=1 Tax=Aquirufa avitistagni TaxID=3104728 RepID=A0ABW6DEP4_9BACT
MNLLQGFPELHNFFLKNQFDSEQLEFLKLTIEANYPDKEIRKKAFSLLNLELLKFKILEEHPEQRVVVPLQQKKFQLEKIRNPYPKSEKKKKVSKPLIQITYETTFPTNIENLCIKLNLTRLELMTICSKKEISIKGKAKLSDEEYKKLFPLFQKRLGEIKAQERKEVEQKEAKRKVGLLNKHKKHMSTYSGDVYDEIAKHGLGKLIYIRSK